LEDNHLKEDLMKITKKKKMVM